MARRKKTTGTYKGRKYNGGSELAAMKMMDRLSKPKRRRRKKGCYVATAVYGSYDCPQVWTLRRYRDEQLEKSFFGRCFISVYYTVSPLLVKMIGNNKKMSVYVRGILDCFVANLNRKGYESLPYTDD